MPPHRPQLAVESHYVVVVVHGFEIHQQRRIAVDAQGGRGHQRALKAMPLALAQHARGRPGRVRVLVLERVNELLDLRAAS